MMTAVLCKHVMLRLMTSSRSENGVENDILWSEIRSEFGEPCGKPPSRSTSPPGLEELPIMQFAYSLVLRHCNTIGDELLLNFGAKFQQ